MSITHRFRVYWLILQTSMAERFAYRSDFALGTLFRFLPISVGRDLRHDGYDF
jgi:phosphomannomutase